MDSMLGETKGQKNSLSDKKGVLTPYQPGTGLSLGQNVFHSGFYNKTNKLIMALYMVTDIMDNEEPLRNKLRELGVEIVSDTHAFSYRTVSLGKKMEHQIALVLSFLEIASEVGIVSVMNASILKKEFMELRQAISETASNIKEESPAWLADFLKEGSTDDFSRLTNMSVNKNFLSKGQVGTRIGVQRGGTLLKALSDKIPDLSSPLRQGQKNVLKNNSFAVHNSEVLKNTRREEIIAIIKDKGRGVINFEGVTITDIKSIGHGVLASCGEKTLQRELVSMVGDGVLLKTGEKRWSKYKLR